MRTAQPVHLGVQGQQLAASAPRAARTRRLARPNSTGAPIAQRSGSRLLTGAQQLVDVGGDAFGDGQRHVRAAGRCLAGNSGAGQRRPRCAGSPPRCRGRRPARSNEPSARPAWLPSRGRTPRRSCVAKSATSIDAGPGGQRGPHRSQPRQRGPVRRLHQPGLPRPAADHQSGTRNTLCGKRFQGQRGVVEGAQLRGDRRPAPRHPGRRRDHAG